MPDVTAFERSKPDKIECEPEPRPAVFHCNQYVDRSISTVAHIIDKCDLPTQIVKITASSAVEKHAQPINRVLVLAVRRS
mgnify:FL=1